MNLEMMHVCKVCGRIILGEDPTVEVSFPPGQYTELQPLAGVYHEKCGKLYAQLADFLKINPFRSIF